MQQSGGRPLQPAPSEDVATSVVRFFHRHFVPILIRLRRGEERQTALLSAFVISVQDKWFLVTAGHCIRNIEDALKQGYQVTRTYLIDHMGQGAKHKNGLPFDWHAANPIQPYPNDGDDYGLLGIRDLYRRNLEANGVQPMSEQECTSVEDQSDQYLMLGLPQELSRLEANPPEIETVLINFKRLHTPPPPEIESENPNRFFGQLELQDGQLDSVVGMSGGPVFRWRQLENGQIKYWLHAIQSSWHRPTKIVISVRIRPFAELISDWLALNGQCGGPTNEPPEGSELTE